MKTSLRVTTTTATAIAASLLLAGGAVATPKNPTPIPESTIKSQCQDPDLGGVYGTTMVGNDRHSTCDYLSDGQYCSDLYINGVFQNTACGRKDPNSPGPKLPPPVQAPNMSPR